MNETKEPRPWIGLEALQLTEAQQAEFDAIRARLESEIPKGLYLSREDFAMLIGKEVKTLQNDEAPMGSKQYLVQIASADELRNKLQRASKKALPGAPYATAYVYRHAFATRLRDSGFKAEDIAAAMGHSVAHTQAKYGIRGGGKRKPKVDLTTIARFEVPRKVKPLDRSGLDFILAKKKASKKFKAP